MDQGIWGQRKAPWQPNTVYILQENVTMKAKAGTQRMSDAGGEHGEQREVLFPQQVPHWY